MKCLFAYSSKSQLTVLDKFEAAVTNKEKHQVSKVYVLPGNHGSDLDVIDFFKGIRNQKDVEIKLHIDMEVTPVAQQAK